MSESPAANPGPPDRELFLAALERPVAERDDFLAVQCGNDFARRERIGALLAEHKPESGFLDTPALVRSAGKPTAGGTVAMSTMLQQGDIALGERIGRYKLLQQIGEGGCGVVYMAEQEEPVRRRVALKIIKLGMDTKGVIARFEAERQALAMMDHPNIAKVLDAGATETGRPYFVMELVRGIKITEYADQNQLATEDRLKLFVQVCNAIQHAHQKGIIHRDIKPSNILVTLHDGVPVPKVIDFGIAKAIEQKLTDKTLFTQFQAFIGTPAYMSPEQAEMSGLDIDTRSDIYSLGVLLYEILTGETPFDPQALISKGIDECRRTIREQEPARPSNRLATMLAADLTTTALHRRIEATRLINLLQGDLDWIVMKCIEKDRSRRYDTAVGLAADVQRYLNSEAVLARPPSNLYRLRKFLRKNRLPVAAAASIAILLIAGSTVSFWLAFRAWRAEGDAKLMAETARSEASRAEQEKRAAHLNEYVADISLAQQSLKDGNLAKAVQLLEKHLPPPGEPDLRGFEWRYLWELSKGDEHLDLPAHDGGVLSVAVSPNGEFLAVSVRDRLHIWNTRSRTKVTTLTPVEGAPGAGLAPRGGRGFRFGGFSSMAFLPDGSALVVATGDKVRSWRTSDWSEQKPLADNFGSVAVSPRGSLVATLKGGFMRREGVALRDVRDWRETQVLTDARAPIAFSPDGTRLASDSPEGIAIWSAATGALVTLMEKSTNVFEGGIPGLSPDRSLAMSPDGRFVVAARNQPSERGVFVVNLWDARTGADLGTLPESAEQIEHTGVISALAFSPDGSLLATASLDHSVRLWRLADRKRIATLQGHLNEVWTLAFAPDGQTLYTGAKDGSVKLWSTTRTAPSHDLAGAATPLGFSRDSSTLATLTRDRTVAFVNLATGEKVREFVLATNRHRVGPEFGRTPGPAVALSRDLRTLVQGTRGGLAQLWNTESGDSQAIKVTDKDFDNLIISPNGRWLIVWNRGPMNRPTWHDVSAGTNFLWEIEADRMGFSPDGRWLVTVHRTDPPRLWATADRSLQATLELPEPQGAYALAFAPDDTRLAVTYADHTIGIWNTESGTLLGICTGHKQPAFALAFSADGTTLASAGADSTLRMWNVATQQELLVDRRLGFNLRNLVFSPDGQWLVGASGNPPQETTRLFKAPRVSDTEVTSRLASKRAQIN